MQMQDGSEMVGGVIPFIATFILLPLHWFYAFLGPVDPQLRPWLAKATA